MLSPGWIPLLSLLVVAAVFAVLLLLMLADSGSRGRGLSRLADQMRLEYRPYAALSGRIRNAHFVLMDVGQFRHFRHLLEGEFRSHYLNLFDYSLVTPGGIATQTLLLLPCPLADGQRFCLCHSRWLEQDNFTESLQYPLRALRPDQKPLLLRRWQLFSAAPEHLWHLLQPALCDWLLAHPHLHIEWSDGILLLCRPRYLLEPDQVSNAVEHGLELVRLLQLTARQ